MQSPTLSYVLSGKQGYEVTSGKVLFKGKNLLKMSTEERAREGLFLIMQLSSHHLFLPI